MENELLEPVAKRPCMSSNCCDDNVEAKQTRIYNISNDCLLQVLDYLNASNLAKLVRIGQKSFCARVLHVAERFQLIFERHQKVYWPSLILQLYNLRHLTIIVPGRSTAVASIPLDGNSLSLSLITLTLNGLILQMDSHHFFSTTFMPRLRHLDLVGTRFQCKNGPVRDVGYEQTTARVVKTVIATYRNLDSLSLPSVSLHRAKFATNISTTLQSLTVGDVPGGTDLSHLDVKTLSIMINLRTDAIILPPTVTNLTLHVEYTVIGNLDDAAPLLPASLVRLKIYAYMTVLNQFFVNRQTLLANVVHFHMVCPGNNEILTSPILAATCRTLPNVTSLLFSDQILLDGNTDLSCLPQSLTRISSSLMFNPNQWKHVPKTCRVLKLASNRGRQVVIAPPYLRHVNDLPNIVESLKYDMMGYIPMLGGLQRSWSGLLCVDVTLGTNYGSPDVVTFLESLPSTVTKLRLCAIIFVAFTTTCFDHLHNLETLGITLKAPDTRQSETEKYIYFDAWVSCLPKRITSLFLAVRDTWFCEDNFSSCRWPKELLALELHMRQCIFPAESVTMSVLTIKKLIDFCASFDGKQTRLKMNHTGKIAHTVDMLDSPNVRAPNALQKYIPLTTKPIMYTNEPNKSE